MWAALERELASVEVRPDEGRPDERRPRTAFLLAEDADALAATAADGVHAAEPVRIVVPGDPLLQLRDRDTLIPDRALQKVVWKNLSPAGLLLLGAQPAGLVRAQKKKDTLQVTVNPLRGLDAKTRSVVAEEAALLAKVRGCRDVRVAYE